MKNVKVKEKSFAVWVCGPPATGKNCICEPAILPLGFELIDVDKMYEELLKKYKLSIENITSNEDHREHSKAIQYARRIAEKLSNETDSNGLVDPEKFICIMKQAIQEGRLSENFVLQLVDKVNNKICGEPTTWNTFRKAVFPKMNDWNDPLDYLNDKKLVCEGHILAVAREITRRNIIKYWEERKNILFVETGGRSGQLINMKTTLEKEGRKTFLVWVCLDNINAAIRRNEVRMDSGGRGLDSAIIERGFHVAEKTKKQLFSEFKPNIIEINNTRNGDAFIETNIGAVRSAIQLWMAG